MLEGWDGRLGPEEAPAALGGMLCEVTTAL